MNILVISVKFIFRYRPFEYERVYLSLREVADTPFPIQWDDILFFIYFIPISAVTDF